MSHLDWMKVDGATRGTPRRVHTRRGRHRLALGLLSCMALVLSGCQSGPFSNGGCRTCGGFFARATNRILHRDKGGCCGSSGVSEGVVEYGGPSAVVVPGAVPSYQSGGVMGTSPSNVSPPVIDTPSQLDPAPTARPIPGPGGGPQTSTGSGARATSYSPSRASTSSTTRTGRTLSSSPASTPEPTPRSAQAALNTRRGSARGWNEDDFLDHLPPLDLPGDVTQSAATPPVPPAAPAAEKKTGQADQAQPSTKSDGDSKAVPTAQQDNPSEPEFTLTLASDSAPETVSTAGAGAGIAHFASVNLKLAGGSGPSATGLTWLAEKGYRTLVDLRESSEVPPTFIADVAGRGLRYVALPVSLKTIDAEHLARFNFEIGSADARPTFFFDSDGSRAGILWYIRRVTIDRVDPQIARREAKELGLVDEAAWSTATDYVDKLEAARANPASTHPTPSHPQATPTTGTAKAGPVLASEPLASIAGPDSTVPPAQPAPTPAKAEPSKSDLNGSREHALDPIDARPQPAKVSGRPPIAVSRQPGLAALRGDDPHGFDHSPGLYDADLGPGASLESSGQSAGTGATTSITSPRVGCLKASSRAWSAIRPRPSEARIRVFARYFESPTIGSPRDANCALS